MPLQWNIDYVNHFVSVAAEGDVTRADVDAYIDAMDAAGAVSFRKVFDGREGTSTMDREEMMAIAVRLRSYHDRPMGGLAIVVPDDAAKIEPIARILGILASAQRPMRLFHSLPPAQRWIASLAPLPGGQGHGCA